MNNDELVTITLRRRHLNTIKIGLLAIFSMFGSNMASLLLQVASGEKPEMTERMIHDMCDDHERVRAAEEAKEGEGDVR